MVRLYDELLAVAKMIGHAAGVAALGFLVEHGVQVITVVVGIIETFNVEHAGYDLRGVAGTGDDNRSPGPDRRPSR